MSLADITSSAVQAAITEYDTLGREAFLAKYGFADAKRYWLVQDGKRYPSKAIAGVAHKYVDGEALLGSSKFTGGESSVVKKLRSLGFEVESVGRNPLWNRDELVLALDLYLSNRNSPPGPESPKVKELSALLNKLHRISGTVAGQTLRNENGVSLKLMNYRALDPQYLAQGKVGMKSGGKLEKLIWAEFADNITALQSEAARIRSAVNSASEKRVSKLPQADEYVGEEGGVIMRLHKRYERDQKLVREKIARASEEAILQCEVCEFEFGAAYGELGDGYIEVHHLKPVSEIGKGGKTKLSDLALLCANCHRMAHRKRKPLTLAELKQAHKSTDD